MKIYQFLDNGNTLDALVASWRLYSGGALHYSNRAICCVRTILGTIRALSL